MCRYEWFDTNWQPPGNQDGATDWIMFLRNDAVAADLNIERPVRGRLQLRKVQ